MPEYYIKRAGEAEGPFGLETLKAMAAQGQITPETPHFLEDLTGWQPIKDNAQLYQAVFPAPKKLTLKPADRNAQKGLTKIPLIPKKEDVTVEDMLEKAEGHTDMTRAKTRQKLWADRVALLSLPVLTLLTLSMGGLLVFAHWEVAQQLVDGKLDGWVFAPGLVLGAIQLVLGLLLLLSMVAVYPAVRYMGLITLGYLGLMAWSYLYAGLWQGWLILWAALGFGLGVHFITLTLRFSIFALSFVLALAAVGAYGFFLFWGL